MPLRILELRTVFGTGGGPEKTILHGTARSDPSRYAITVCYIRDERDATFSIDRRAEDLGVQYVEVRERHSFDPSIWRKLRAIVEERRIEIVHAHDYKTDLLALLLARYQGVIPLATAHGWTGHSLRERGLYYPVDRRLLARFPRVIAVSSEIRAALLTSGANPLAVSVVLNAIDPFAFSRKRDQQADARALFGLGRGDVVIGAIGRLEPQKRFDLLVAVFSRVVRLVPAAHLLIGGDGSLRGALERQIANAGLTDRCRLVGHVEDVRVLHHALDLFVQASSYEGTPNAVLEAMALETPIVATDVGGTAELARDGVEALIVSPKNEQALAGAVIEALNDPAAAGRRAAAARKRVETDLSFEARMRKVERIYDELADTMLRPGAGRRAGAHEVCATR
jgi:glycosyltransferase involved in cell wall biosynthesis